MVIKLKKLLLKNFKGIKNLVIDFADITNIKGENATGKTTIFDAFTWLLFDKDSQDRSTFEIKTLDVNGEPFHGLNHEVTGILDVDNRQVTLTKTLKEKWTKKRGEATSQLTGHETLYYVNEVPVKQSEYKDKVNSFVNETIFKLISNPLYFSNMNWKDRRKVLLDIIGDIESDKIISYNSKLAGLEILLDGTDIETLKRQIAARKKKLNDDIKSLPYRIDECNNSIKEVDFEGLEFSKRNIRSGINSIDEKIADSSKVGEGILEEKNKLYGLKSKLQDMEYSAADEARKPYSELNKRLEESIRTKVTAKSKLVIAQNEIENMKQTLIQKELLRNDLRTKFTEENGKELKFNENEFICPTCQRSFDADDIESKKAKMLENFNLDKAEKVRKVREQGHAVKDEIERLELKISSFDTSSLESEINIHEEEVENLRTQIDQFVQSPSYGPEYEILRQQITDLEAKLQKPSSESDTLFELKSRKRDLSNELDTTNGQLAYKEQNETLRARIKVLEADEKRLGEQIAELEGQEFLCEEFTKTKVELLESSINNKFKLVKFKLFNTLVNGGLEDCCEALVDGVPFSNANTASQINAGIDIINTLTDYYNVSAPIFIDNRESVNDLIETESQIVNLIVSKDKTLRIENSESEVA